MNIEIQLYQGEKLNAEIGVLSDFRLRYFREFPYLYVGTKEYEKDYLATYLSDPTTRLLLARDRDKNGMVVGVAIGTMLSPELKILCQTDEFSQYTEFMSEQFFYFGEMIFVPEYRSKGVGKQLSEELKEVGRKQGADRFCFFAVDRVRDDIRRPADYVDSDVFFQKFGFEKTNISVSYDWPTIQADGRVEENTNRLWLWVDRKH
jgi:GNAT superfamily N-acetyltransferase